MKDVVEIMARAICREDCTDRENDCRFCNGYGYHTNEAEAALSALDAAGYAVVPKEPTEAMLTAGVPRLMSSGRGSNALCFAYRAMLQASQSDTGRGG